MTLRTEDLRIVSHHVGGRAGSRSFPEIPAFEKDFVNVLYEADPTCIEQIRTANASRPSELHVVPACVGRKSGARAKLHLNYDPYTSSLLPFNEAFGGYYYTDNDSDYVFGEAFAAAGTLPVTLQSLDTLVESGDGRFPPPDFLSLDTQGSELDILHGAAETLHCSVLAAVVEVEFQPLYRGQSLFGDVTSFLAARGFQFVRFLVGQQVSPYRAPIGLRADGFHLFDDALFLRSVADIEALQVDKAQRWIMLKKLAFIAIAYRQFEYALLCLEAAGKLAPREVPVAAAAAPAYLVFLDELEVCVAEVPAQRPRGFASKYSLEESRARFSSGAQGKDAKVLNIVIRKEDAANLSSVERHLADHGFGPLAETVRNKRLVQKCVYDFLAANPGFDESSYIAGINARVE